MVVLVYMSRTFVPLVLVLTNKPGEFSVGGRFFFFVYYFSPPEKRKERKQALREKREDRET